MAPATLALARLDRLKRLRELQLALKQSQDEQDGLVAARWEDIARPEQLPPPGDYFVWLILAGRGWGKSRTAAEWSAMKARKYPGCRIALVARTIGDARDTMVEGDSGLLNCFSAAEMRGGSYERGWNRSLGELYLDNGSRFKTFSSEKPWRLRGPQHNFAWADEACFWEDAHKGCLTDTTWVNLTITCRLKKKKDWANDYRAQVVIATTPRPVPLLKTSDPDPSRLGIMQRTTTIITRGRTSDNFANLSDEYKENVIAPLLGTRLGRQELDAELLEDNEAALWRREWIDETRITDPDAVPDLIRVVVGVDPAVTDGESSAQTGIVVAGAAKNGKGYVLADFTLRGTPMDTMKKVTWAFHEFNADRVVAEVNNGGDYIGTLLKTVDPDVPFQAVRASRGKAIRAEPISSLYEQRRICHVGSFPYLEDNLCFVAGTKITTSRGDISIENVTRADSVLTRAGWQSVVAAGCTGTQRTVTVLMSDGRTLTCTPNHPVFVVGKGYTPAGDLLSRDKIITCLETSAHVVPGRQNFRSSTTMVNDTTSGLLASTTALLAHEVRDSSIVTCMKTTSVQFPTDSSCITSITTEKITLPVTSSPCPNPITSHITSDIKSLACTPHQVTSNVSSRRKDGSAESNQSSAWNALSVASRSRLLACERRFALELADDVTVLFVRENEEPSVVYNLSIARQPEYFANGVLVHNCSWTPQDPESPDRLDACVWAITALKDLIGGSFLSAYGVVKCETCGAAFTLKDPATGAERTKCVKCAAPLEVIAA